MSKKRKLLQKILGGSRNIRFAELVGLLIAFGFVEERVSGSHHIYKHASVPAMLSLQPTQNGQAKPYQIRQFLKLVEEYDLHLHDDDSIEEDET